MYFHFLAQVILDQVPGSPCLLMQPGDKLGIFVGTAPSSVVYVFDFSNPSTLLFQYADPNDSPATGDILAFDSLRQSYRVSAFATVDTGQRIL